ncbi:uncharacterized protein EI90DRAFT_2926729, partial [Cantharellus anzutake]|uniref:uncharacterized protein n=1 Tax=Cantharellus anzutake TaxID=1750568 RepID=UPI0019039EBA
RIGPFRVIREIGKNAYCVELPPSFLCLHLVFNVNLLEPYISPAVFQNHLEIDHPAADPSLVLFGNNPLKIKGS